MSQPIDNGGTPRTDEAAFAVEPWDAYTTRSEKHFTEPNRNVLVSASFARQLERELAAAKLEIQSLEGKVRAGDVIAAQLAAERDAYKTSRDFEAANVAGYKAERDQLRTEVAHANEQWLSREAKIHDLRAQLAASAARTTKLEEALRACVENIRHIEWLRVHDTGPTPSTLTTSTIRYVEALLQPSAQNLR